MRDILTAIFFCVSGSGVRIQEGYGITFLEGADYVLTRSRSKLQSCYTKWGIKRERERKKGRVFWLYGWGLLVLVGEGGNRAFTAVWKPVLSGQQSIRGFCPTSYTKSFTWKPNFLGESILDCGTSGNRYGPPPKKKTWLCEVLCVNSVNTLDMNEITEIQITSNFLVAPTYSIQWCVFVVSHQMPPLISGSNFPFLSSVRLCTQPGLNWDKSWLLCLSSSVFLWGVSQPQFPISWKSAHIRNFHC